MELLIENISKRYEQHWALRTAVVALRAGNAGVGRT